jgi:hypothetical protein
MDGNEPTYFMFRVALRVAYFVFIFMRALQLKRRRDHNSKSP